MADNISSIVVSFGAAVDDKTFKQSLTRLRNFMAEFAQEMKKKRPTANTTVFDDFVKRADDVLGKKGRLGKLVKEGMADALLKVQSNVHFKKALAEQARIIETENDKILKAQKDANKKQKDELKKDIAEKEALLKKRQELAAQYTNAAMAAAGAAGTIVQPKGASVSASLGASGVAVASEDAKSKLSELEKRYNKFIDRFGDEITSNKFLGDLYKGTVGRALSFDKGGSLVGGQYSSMIAAEKEFQKYATAAFQFEKVGGGRIGFKASEADYSRIFQAISDKTIRFDKDIGFFSTNFQAAAKALGITVDGFLQIQNKMNQGVDVLGKIKMMDAKYGTTGIDSAKSLQGIYKDPNVYAPSLYKTMQAEQKPWFQKLGVMGDTTAVANAAIQGNIDLTNKSLKVNNELGLKALKIDEARAIKLGILNKEYGGNAYQLQQQYKNLNKLSPEYKKIFDALNVNMKDPASIKRSLDVVKFTEKEVARLRDAGKAYDALNTALERQQSVLAGKQKEPKVSKSAFDRVYDSQLFNTDAAKNALTRYSQVFAEKGSADMARALPVFKQVEAEVRKQSLALIAAGRDGKYFADTFDRVSAVNAILSGNLKITARGFESIKDQLNPLEKLMLKYNGSSEQLRQSILKVAQTEEVGTKSFNNKVRALELQEKKIIDTIEKMKALGRTEQEILTFRGTADPMALAFNARSDGAKKSAETMKQVALEYKKTENQASLLSRALKDLYEKFKILAGYAISGSIAYGIGNAFKNAIANVIQYDQALKDLQAITRSTSFEVERMGEKIKEVATSTKFSVLEVAEGMKILGQTGMSASESMEAIMPIAQLATATLSDFATINDLVSSALGAFGLEAKDTERVVDVFGAAINQSKLNVDKLRVAMNYVGPIASDAGLSLEEMAAAMGLFANAGLRASTIGTAFRQIISQLMTPSKEFQDAIESAGYTLEEMNPRTQGFSNIIEKLTDVVPDAENAFKFFGQRGASAVSVLTKAGKEGFEDMVKQMSRLGSVSQMAAKQLEGMAVIAKQTKDTIGVMSLETSDAIGVTDGLRIALVFFRDTLQDVRSVFSGWGGAIVEWTLFISAAIVAIGALSGAISGLATTAIGGGILTGIGAGFAFIGTSATVAASAVTGFFASLGPIGWAIAGITALVGVWKVYNATMGESSKTIDDHVKKVSIDIENQKKATKEYELRIQYVNDLVYAMEDENRSLEERKYAFSLLAQAGADLDTSILSNITNVRQFEAVLNNTKGSIDSYIGKLRNLSEESKGAVFRLFEQRAKLGQQKIEEVQAESQNGVMTGWWDNFFGILDPIKETDPEKIQEQLQEWADKNADGMKLKSSYNDILLDSFNQMLKDDEGFAEAFLAAKADPKSENAKNALNAYFDDLVKRYRLDPVFLKGMVDGFIKDETSVDAAISAIKEYGNKTLRKAKELSNPKESSELAKLNIQNAVIYQEDVEAKNKLELQRLKEAGASADDVFSETERINNANKKLAELTKDSIQKNLDIIKNNMEEDLKAQEELKNQNVAAAKRVAAEKGTTAASREAEEFELQAEMDFAILRMERYEELEELARKSGLSKEKYMQTLNSLQQQAITAYETAKMNYATGMKGLDKKDSQEYEKELAERLRRLHKVYGVEKERFDTEEARKLAENDRINQFNTRTREEKEFQIKLEYANKRLLLAQKLIEKENEIKNAGGKEGFVGQKDLEKINQEIFNLQGAEDTRKQAISREDIEMEREINWEKQELILQDNMDFYAQASGLADLEHQKRLETLAQNFLDEKITWENFLASVENENLRHGQKMAEIDRKTKDMRLGNQIQLVSELGGLMGELYSISGEKAKGLFYAQKAMVVTEMIMNAYKTWSNAMATPNVSPAFNIPMASAMLAMGLAKAGMVAGLTIAQGVKGFAEGGEITGYSPTPTADNVPIMATAGEFMQPVPTVQYYGKGVMEALRTRSIPRDVLSGFSKSNTKSGGSRFAEGGEISASPEQNNTKEQQSMQIVNILDPTMFDQYVSSHAGQKAIMNVISRNPAIIKNSLR